MELDDMKLAWQTLDRRLEQHNAINLQVFKDGRFDKTRSALRPLFLGQFLQLLFGVAVAATSAMFWIAHRDVAHLLITGLIMHAYGVMTIAFAARSLLLIGQIDYAAPVLTIQKQMGELRNWYVYSGLAVGLPWWFLWALCLTMFFESAFGADLFVNAPSVIYANVVVGVLGLLATYWFGQWLRSPKRPQLAKRAEDSLTGSSLRKAQSILDEVSRFEQM